MTNNTAEFERVKDWRRELDAASDSESIEQGRIGSVLCSDEARTGALVHVLIVILQMGLIITALVVAVGVAFYAARVGLAGGRIVRSRSSGSDIATRDGTI